MIEILDRALDFLLNRRSEVPTDPLVLASRDLFDCLDEVFKPNTENVELIAQNRDLIISTQEING